MDVSGSLGEFGRIRRFFAPLAASPAAFGLTDDAALLGPDRVVTADAIVETVHFLPADPPELVATTIAFAIESGEAHLMVGDPPRPVVPGSDDPWAGGLARPMPARAGWGGGTPGQAAPLDQGAST